MVLFIRKTKRIDFRAQPRVSVPEQSQTLLDEEANISLQIPNPFTSPTYSLILFYLIAKF